MRLPVSCVLGAVWLLGCASRSAPSPAAAAVAPAAQEQPRIPPAPAAVAREPATAAAPADAAAAVGASPEIDALIERALAEHKLPGCVVAIGHGDGIAFLRAYGRRALVPKDEPMTVDTVFDLASLTKPIATAAAVMRLADDGALRVADRAAAHLPQLERSSTRAITVRQLLLHAAGLPHANPLRQYESGPQAALAATLALEPSAAPSGAFFYSDIGYLWLGELVRQAAQMPLDRYVEQTLFAPLGMRETRFAPGPELLARIAPTELTELRGPQPLLIRGTVHDPRAYRLGGVAGHAGLFSTAQDLARFARMLLQGGALEGTRVLSESAVTEMTRPVAVGSAQRALGWDVRSEYSRLRGSALSERAFGHGGHTGTSLWIDPGRDLFVLLLSNRVHPDGKGNVIGLAGELADAAVRAFGQRDPRCAQAAPARVLPGIDVLRASGYAELQGKRVGVLSHLAARSTDGVPTLDLLARAPGVTLSAIFSPEHGLSGEREGVIASSASSPQGAPVHSLFGKNRRPTPEMLRGLDVLVVDLVDVGARFYTYMSSLRELLRAAGEQHLPVLVLDRPNPLGAAIEGPVLDDDVRTFVNHYALPVRHGLTAGELATLMNEEQRFGANLHVIEVSGLRREFDQARSGLRWWPPSPNLKSPAAALLYPAVGLLESTNLSVGRGTPQPFEQVGAPFVDANALLARLRAAELPGVRFARAEFTPARDRHAKIACHGVKLTVDDPARFRPVRTGLEIARAVHELYGDAFELDKLMRLLGNAQALSGLRTGTRVAALERQWEPTLHQYRRRIAPYLRYPTCE